MTNTMILSNDTFRTSMTFSDAREALAAYRHDAAAGRAVALRFNGVTVASANGHRNRLVNGKVREAFYALAGEGP